jgi:hypothetical protein
LGSPTIRFNSVDVSSDVGVSYSDSLTGGDSGNYELSFPTGLKAQILARKLTYSASASNKVYDGSTSASVTASDTLIADPAGDNAGVLSGDDVSLTGSASGTFVSADASSSTTVTFSGKSLDGSKKGNYTLTHPNNVSAAIFARKLTVRNLTPVNKEYDGTKTATVTGTPSLTALLIANGGNSNDGVVSGDVGEVTLSETASYEFSSKNVGDSLPVTMGGATLEGGKSHNYTLHTPPGLQANITKRPLNIIVASHKSKLVGQSDPTFSFGLDPDSSYASGESAATIGGLNWVRTPGTEPGAYRVTVTTGSLEDSTPQDNYDITVDEKYLYIARAEITTTQVDGVVTQPEVTCSCEGFRPDAIVTLTMYSDPTVLATAVVEANGTCPDLEGSIPVGTSGSHTLEITSEFPNEDELEYRELITLAANIPPSDDPPSDPPGSEQTLTVFVWLDLDGDGVQDDDEPDLPGVSLEVSEAQTFAT